MQLNAGSFVKPFVLIGMTIMKSKVKPWAH